MHVRFLLAALTATGLAATPAQAHEPAGAAVRTVQVSPGHWGGPFGQWYGGWQPQIVILPAGAAPAPQAGYPAAYPGAYPGMYEGQTLDRDSWLRECRRRLGDNGVGGAVIGGLVGGVAGNVIAGKGNRVLGTVAGAAVGAVAGSAIDKAEDRTRVQDRCEAMLAAPPAQAYGASGYGYGYGFAMPMMLVPVMMVPVAHPAAAPAAVQRREVIEEIIEEPAGRRSRSIPRRVAPDKRIKM